MTYFSLLHKGGDTEDASSWRPIAILSISYKIMAKLLFNSIQLILEIQQVEEEFGFRKNRSTTHALLILESMLSKGIEFNVPIGVISIDLRKVFDRIEYNEDFIGISDDAIFSPQVVVGSSIHALIRTCTLQHYFGTSRSSLTPPTSAYCLSRLSNSASQSASWPCQWWYITRPEY